MNTGEQKFVRGFNHGYMLTKHEPKLVWEMTKTLQPTTDYLDGFFSGKEEWELEHSREQLSELDRLRNNGKDRERDLSNE
jgi:hypothetical protein